MQEAEPRVHHAKPFIMSREIRSECPNRFSKPFLDSGVVHIIIVDPVFVTGVVRGINDDTFDSTSIVR